MRHKGDVHALCKGPEAFKVDDVSRRVSLFIQHVQPALPDHLLRNVAWDKGHGTSKDRSMITSHISVPNLETCI